MAEARLEQLQMQNEQLDSAFKMIKEQDMVINKQRRDIAAKQLELQRRSELAAKTTAATVANLRKELTVVQQGQLDSIVVGYEHQLSLSEQRIEQQKALTRLAEGQLATRDTMIDKLRTINRDLLKQLDVETKRNKMSLGNKLVMYGGWIAAGVLAVSK